MAKARSAAASLSGLTPLHPQFDLPLPGFEKVPGPYWYGAKTIWRGVYNSDTSMVFGHAGDGPPHRGRRRVDRARTGIAQL